MASFCCVVGFIIGLTVAVAAFLGAGVAFALALDVATVVGVALTAAVGVAVTALAGALGLLVLGSFSSAACISVVSGLFAKPLMATSV